MPRAGCCALCIVTLAMPVTLAGSLEPAAATSSCANVKKSGPWSTIAVPTWPGNDATDESTNEDGSGLNVEVAVDPAASNVGYVSDGRRLDRTTDGGCTWTEVFNLDMGSPTTSPDEIARVHPQYVIKSVATSPAANATKPYVYLSLAPRNRSYGDLGPSVVEVSRDGGASWTADIPTAPDPTLSNAAPAYAWGASAIVAAPSDPRTAYVAAYIPSGFQNLRSLVGPSGYMEGLFVTHDAGSTWSLALAAGLPISFVSGLGAFGTLRDMSLAVDPAKPSELWFCTIFPDTDPTTGGATIYRSTDGGATFRPVFHSRLVAQDSSAPPFLAFWSQPGKQYVVARSVAAAFLTADNGSHWTTLPSVPLWNHHAGLLEGAAPLPGRHVLAIVGYVGGSPSDMAPFQRTDTVIYCPATNKWRTLPAPPIATTKVGLDALQVSRVGTSPVVYMRTHGNLIAAGGSTPPPDTLIAYTNPTPPRGC